MGRKKIQISRINDERNRQVKIFWCIHIFGLHFILFCEETRPDISCELSTIHVIHDSHEVSGLDFSEFFFFKKCRILASDD